MDLQWITYYYKKQRQAAAAVAAAAAATAAAAAAAAAAATSDKEVIFGSVGLSVCQQYYSKTYEWTLMKFSLKTEDGTSDKPLNFGSDTDHG